MARRPGKNFLFVPGPTNVPERVLRAMVVSQEDHRSPIFPELTKPLYEGLKKVYKTTEGQVFIFPSSGTGGWEAALANTLAPGDKVLNSRFGQFSHLWTDMAQRLGLDVQILEEEWGTGAHEEKIEEALVADKAHEIKAVMVVHNETATGVTSNIGAIRKAIDAAKHPALLLVDSVSGLGSIDFRFDEWKVDCAVSGSQKGLMLPAGLGFVAVSQKALNLRKNSKLNKVYFDFQDHINTNPSGYFPYTPATPLLHGLKEALACIEDEGLEQIFHRHSVLANATRKAIDAWGLKLCAKSPRWHSDTVSAILAPEGIDAAKIIATAYNRYNLALGAGLSKVAGKVFRIGHIGDLNELMLLGALAGAEMAMLDNGVKIKAGSGVGAAQDYLRDNPIEAQAATPKAA
ncbi:aminotransferase class V-fold PLP-dependent enzyme [Methylopila sp. M107]|uniref:aminotransferase class V-fold PLP-dependent enzyme n=1 Tax=Methylopila sp. M107 TaxID=1101190 RepID=UPI00047840CE|nr:aminotransferase class V-fold PLP-dependent enzyme [Methylopila sp. M107]